MLLTISVMTVLAGLGSVIFSSLAPSLAWSDDAKVHRAACPIVTCQSTEDSRIGCRGVRYRKRYYTRGLLQYLHDSSFAPSAALSSKPKCGVGLEMAL